MKHLIPLALLLAACSQGPVAGDNETDIRPNVVLETTLGEIEIEVYSDTAPISGGDFLMFVDEGLYDGEGFYRVVRPDNDPLGMGMSLIQGGIIDVGTSDDNYGEFTRPPIAHERTIDTGLSNTRGTVSIARLEPGTGSAGYFFINIGDNDFLDYGGARNPDGEGYASFGKVVRGMDVVEAIQAGDASGESPDPITNNQYLAEPVIITQAYRVED